ncbi:uncharacterized protein LOC107367372 [Tetranychus urticae]|uniref:Uncharacterized protein n=1 Tax=Tetranychus urticae TaxID=32264 RepID=T1KTZ5_TETUR|nr:uncharacterized protein LOC107367372 [Tetranychus urticae]
MASVKLVILIISLFSFVNSQKSYFFNRPQQKRLQYFDDYLMNNDDKVVIIEMNDGDSQESKLTSKSGKIVENSFSTSSSTESAPKITTSTQSPENKEDLEALNCCHLGHLAGNRGYHCHVGFYSARIMRRNENRAHNKKLYFNGKHRDGLYGTETMRRFEYCIESRSNMFHKCCKIASRFHRHGPRYDTAKRLHSG